MNRAVLFIPMLGIFLGAGYAQALPDMVDQSLALPEMAAEHAFDNAGVGLDAANNARSNQARPADPPQPPSGPPEKPDNPDLPDLPQKPPMPELPEAGVAPGFLSMDLTAALERDFNLPMATLPDSVAGLLELPGQASDRARDNAQAGLDKANSAHADHTGPEDLPPVPATPPQKPDTPVIPELPEMPATPTVPAMPEQFDLPDGVEPPWPDGHPFFTEISSLLDAGMTPDSILSSLLLLDDAGAVLRLQEDSFLSPSPEVASVYSLTASAAVPVPTAVWLFGSALGLLGWMRRKAA